MNESVTYTEANLKTIELCQKGDQTAYEQLYRLYNKAMFNVCMRLLNNTQEAEDVLQESFITAFKSLQQYSKKASFGNWLKRIVINRCIDTLRKRQLNFVGIEDHDLVEERTEHEDNVTYKIEQVKEAMTSLPDGYRLILTLFAFEDFSHKEIAEKLGIREGTSKSQYARAKKKLVEIININNTRHEG